MQKASYIPGRGPRAGRARKRLGQHFLAPAWAAKIVRALAPEPGDVFLEIGPGRGALTFPLAETGAPVLAVELDRDLVAELAQRVPRNVTVFGGDFLQADVVPLLLGLGPHQGPGDHDEPRRRFRVVGNLPYYIASPILFRLIELVRTDRLFSDATVMVQREVADRLTARPGTKAYGVLTILVGLHAKVTRVLDLPPGAFTPAPKVHSTVVRLTFSESDPRPIDEVWVERLVKRLFGQRRKTLANALKPLGLAGVTALAKSGLDGRRRPETLSLSEVVQLANLFAAPDRPVV